MGFTLHTLVLQVGFQQTQGSAFGFTLGKNSNRYGCAFNPWSGLRYS